MYSKIVFQLFDELGINPGSYLVTRSVVSFIRTTQRGSRQEVLCEVFFAASSKKYWIIFSLLLLTSTYIQRSSSFHKNLTLFLLKSTFYNFTFPKGLSWLRVYAVIYTFLLRSVTVGCVDAFKTRDLPFESSDQQF